MKFVAYLLIQLASAILIDENEQELSNGHLKYFKTNKEQRHCKKRQSNCLENKSESKKNYCWGYEKHCIPLKNFEYPECTSYDSRWGSNSLVDARRLFWEQADFGYIKKKLETIQYICKPKNKKKNKSLLKCSETWEYCRGKNIFIDFSQKTFKDNNRFNHNFLSTGELGGYCSTNEDLKKKKFRFNKELNSWKSDLERFTSLAADPFTDQDTCQVVIEKPVVFMKLDAGVNLYHHYCDFFNLYASQHMNGSFSKDIFIYAWDTSYFTYHDLFADSWKAFSIHPLNYLREFAGKKVCFKDVIFSLPPRMMYGLYYNTPLLPSCHGTSLFAAFSQHLIYRLGISQQEYKNDVVRVTLLARSTKFRKIINQDALVAALKKHIQINVTLVDYNRELPFLKQVEISHNSDVLIGMHGAGLTHMLFQPDWGAVFELYNTGDADCYLDLARLRGLSYFTWVNKEKLFPEDKGHHPTLGAHEKFTNYAFDVTEFMIIINKAVQYVLNRRPSYI